MKTNRMALPRASPSANSKNAVAGSTDDERVRATTTRPRAPHQTFLQLGPVVHTRTVTMVVAMPTDPWSFHANFPTTLWRATWLNDPGSMSRRTEVVVDATTCPIKLARTR